MGLKKNTPVVSYNSNIAIYILAKMRKLLQGVVRWDWCCSEVVKRRAGVLRINFFYLVSLAVVL